VIYNQAHNQYFHTLATKGLVGIVILIMLFSVLLWVPLKRILANLTDKRELNYLASCCISIIMAYAILCLTESPFERRSAIVFFVFFYSFSLATMKNIESENMS